MGLLASLLRLRLRLLQLQQLQDQESRGCQMDSADTSSHLNSLARLSHPLLSDPLHRASCLDLHPHSPWHTWPQEPQRNVLATLSLLRQATSPLHRPREP